MTGVFLKAFTRSAGLWDALIDAGVEAAADGNVAGGVAGLSSLVPQFLFSPPFGSSVGEPHLRARRRSVTKAFSTNFLTPLLNQRYQLTCILASGRSIFAASLSLAKTSG